jgi:hypothetical protein
MSFHNLCGPMQEKHENPCNARSRYTYLAEHWNKTQQRTLPPLNNRGLVSKDKPRVDSIRPANSTNCCTNAKNN